MTKALLLALLMCGCLTGQPPTGGDDDTMNPVPPPDAPKSPPDAPPPGVMDASGTWGLTIVWGAGTCGLTLDLPAEMVVSHGTTGYVVSDASPDTTISGTVLCSSVMCHASFTQTGRGRGENTISMTLASDLVATSDGLISGSGGVTYQFRDGTNCTQQFTASGRLR
jgi:hypothetical protein